MTLHRNVAIADNHGSVALTYANAAARTGDTTLTSVNVGMIAKQTDTAAYYILQDTAPTWAGIGTAPTLTAGSIPFSDGTGLTQENADLFYDSSANTLQVTGGAVVGAKQAITSGYVLDQVGAGGTRHARSAATSGTPANWLFTGAAHTGLTASTENISAQFNCAATTQWATGALTTQRTFVINAQTLAFVGSSTVTTAVTFEITGAPTAGTNATITRALAMRVTGNSCFVGTLNIGTDAATTANYQVDIRGAGGFRVAPSGGGSGISPSALFVGASHSGQTASTENSDCTWDGTVNTIQWATGALATQRTYLFKARTNRFVGASTISDAATVAIDNAPIAGTNATITRAMALWVQAGASRFSGAVIEDSAISPTALSGSSNNYNPTNLSTCRVIRQDCSAASTLTGLTALQAGGIVTIINIATNVTFTLTLTNEDASSTAANRFTLSAGASLVIAAGGSATLWYDTTSARWRPIV